MAADGVFLSSAELYDPATHAFVETGPAAVAHTSHTATLLPNGKVLVAGGTYNQPQQTAELYDPATGRFSPAPGMSPERRDGFTATLLTTGEALDLVRQMADLGVKEVTLDPLDQREVLDEENDLFTLAGEFATYLQ